ncbi:hypothetical protein EDB80DRAFT_782710 [Ilyonectria destructans]|nr:hypothetical protein EDB80DRAFT_782710 [Ilyonectria destructans]
MWKGLCGVDMEMLKPTWNGIDPWVMWTMGVRLCVMPGLPGIPRIRLAARIRNGMDMDLHYGSICGFCGMDLNPEGEASRGKGQEVGGCHYGFKARRRLSLYLRVEWFLSFYRSKGSGETRALADLGIHISADIFEAAQRQFQEAARIESNSVPLGAVDAPGLADLGILTSAGILQATQREYEQPRESGSVERQPRSLEDRLGNNELARLGNNQPARPALFQSVQMDGGSRVPLAPRLASEDEAHNQPNTAMLAGPDFRPSAEMMEAGRRSLVAGLGLRTVADISEESRNENFRQRRRARTVLLLPGLVGSREGRERVLAALISQRQSARGPRSREHQPLSETM